MTLRHIAAPVLARQLARKIDNVLEVVPLGNPLVPIVADGLLQQLRKLR